MKMIRLRFSLANKCQLAFGAAVALILFAALTVPWWRMQRLVDESQREVARQLSEAWLRQQIRLSGPLMPTFTLDAGVAMIETQNEADRFFMRVYEADELDGRPDVDSQIVQALSLFDVKPDQSDSFERIENETGITHYRYIRAIRQEDLDRMRGGFTADVPSTQVTNPVRMVLLIEMQPEWAARQLLLNGIHIIIAGLLAVVLAIAVFWFITMRVILSPVRVLRDTTERVVGGDLTIRSDINTGDEFETLSDTFNEMLANLKNSQDTMKELNKQLDLKLGELAETNVSLFEANRLKGEFLANVSHELRTPLNSIIGFAEVLAETIDSASERMLDKRKRYLANILTSSRSLLDLINDLLDLAKIEAGRIDLHIDKMSVADVCEGLINLIRPQADAKLIRMTLSVTPGIPLVQTDPGKFQQILFNFLSNAVKFTPNEGRVELGASLIAQNETDTDLDDLPDEELAVRVWVTDSGPGIPPEAHDTIFEKFKQLESSHTKEHGGTGLGLAISRELSEFLNGRIEIESDVGEGATFILTIPLKLERESEILMPGVVLSASN